VHTFVADRVLGREEMLRGGDGILAKARVDVVMVE
jgi:hypothetical protein